MTAAAETWVDSASTLKAWEATASTSGILFNTLGSIVDASGGVDFIHIIASGAAGGPYFEVTTDRPVTITSTPITSP